MKKSLFSSLFLLLVSISYAQTPDKKADIKKLLEVTGAGKLGVQRAKQVLDAFQANYSSAADKKFFEDFAKEINAEELENMLMPIYDKYYSHDEIKELIAFYNTPIGKKVINTLPAISAESMQVGQQWGKAIAEKIIARMKEKGYLDEEKQMP